MPVALRRPPGRSRSRWYSNYVNLVIGKDVLDITRVRQREMLPRLLGQLAARSGQVLNMAAISGTIGLEESTTENYIKLLEAVFLIYRLPAWGTTLGSRVTKHPKVHLVDSGVMAWLLNLTPQMIAQAAPASLTGYGHLLETFAVGEILKQASWADAPVTAGHFRTEVDLVLERDGGQVIGVEVKAGSRISGEDLRGLRQLKERLGPGWRKRSSCTPANTRTHTMTGSQSCRWTGSGLQQKARRNREDDPLNVKTIWWAQLGSNLWPSLVRRSRTVARRRWGVA
jgi:predicted AAA+ superfamily ATPase